MDIRNKIERFLQIVGILITEKKEMLPIEREKLAASDEEVETYIQGQTNLLNGSLRGWFDPKQKQENGDNISYVLHITAEYFFILGQKHSKDNLNPS